MRYSLIILLLLMHAACTQAQVISFKDTIAAYNLQRIRINVSGARILGVWGIANIAAGGIGYATAKQDEWKYFHEMNAGWGVVNTAFAAAGLWRSHRELQKFPGFDRSYRSYRSNKKAYLLGSGLDVVFIIGGAALARYGEDHTANAAMFRGFGRSITLQGVALLLFDNVMFASQLKNNSNWFRIMNEIHMSGNGIGFNYTF